MKDRGILLLVVGLVVGGLLVGFLGPSLCKSTDEGLVDGKYIVVENDYGNWVYERMGNGFQPVVKELTPLGLKSIWELQAEFKPMELHTAEGDLVSVPGTPYSTDTGSFSVVYRFYRLENGELIDVPVKAPTAGD